MIQHASSVDPHARAETYPSLAQQAGRYAKLDPKLVTAAHQFEASLIQELLKPMTSNSLFGEDEEDSSSSAGSLSSLSSSADGSGSALMSFGSEALAKALSEKGGLGIARKILDHFEATEAPAKAVVSSPNWKTQKELPSITKVI